MANYIKKLAAMTAAAAVTASSFPAFIIAANADTNIYEFTFGSNGNIKTDCGWGEHNGLTYGLMNIDTNSKINDTRFDGWGEELLTYPEAGSINGVDYIKADYSKYDDEIKSKMGKGLVPLRFSVKAEPHEYYTVTATVVNTSATTASEISLFSENRRPIMFNESVPAGQTVTKTWNVNLEGQYYNATGAYTNDAVNIAVTGENAGLVSVKIEKHDKKGITAWLCNDSTGDDCPASLPYYQLSQRGGVGQFMQLYINPEIAISNQGEGGLTSSDKPHLENALKYMQAGDYLFVQYGFNGESTASLKKNLPRYYEAAHEKGAYLVVVSTTERHSSSFWDSSAGTWNNSNAAMAAAAKEYVDEKLAEGANDIAYIDLNTGINEWMNTVAPTVLAQRQKAGFNDTANSRLSMDYYYWASRSAGVDNIHMNDAGGCNGAYIVLNEARKQSGTDFMARLVENTDSNARPYQVSDETVSKGWAPNEEYPYPLTSDVVYEYPIYINNVVLKDDSVSLQSDDTCIKADANYDENGRLVNISYEEVPLSDIGNERSTAQHKVFYWKSLESMEPAVNPTTAPTVQPTDEPTNAPTIQPTDEPTNAPTDEPAPTNEPSHDGQSVDYMTVTVQGDMSYYARGAVDILDAGGSVIKTYYSSSTDVNPLIDHIDNTAYTYGQEYKLYFASADIPDNCTYRAYVVPVENNGGNPVEGEKNYSPYYTAPAASREILMTSDVSTAWKCGGSATTKASEIADKNGKPSFRFTENGTGSYTAVKRFDNNSEVTNGIIKLHFNLCHEYGSYILRLGTSTKEGSFLEGMKTLNMKDGVLYSCDESTEIGKVKAGKFTPIDVTLDLINGTQTVSIAGSDPVVCEIDKLKSSSADDTADILPIRSFGINSMATGSTIPSYSFEAYISDIDIHTEECTLPKYKVNAVSENAEFGTVSGSGEYEINSSAVLSAKANDGYEFAGWYSNGEKLSGSGTYTIRVRNDINLTAKFNKVETDPNVLKWSFSAYSDSALKADKETVSEYSGLKIHLNSGDELSGNGLYWSAAGGSTSDSTTTVSNNRYIEFTPERDGKLEITYSGSISSSKAYPRMYVSSGSMVKDSPTSIGYDNKAGADKDATGTWDLKAGTTYYIWGYCYSRPNCTFTITSMKYTMEGEAVTTPSPSPTDTPAETTAPTSTPTETAAPTDTPSGTDSEGNWDFSSFKDNSITASSEESKEYFGLDIHMNSGDTITDSGLVWKAPGATTSDSKPVANNRYMTYTPAEDGVLTLVFQGDRFDKTSKAPRMYIVAGDDVSCTNKTNGDTGAQATASKANTDTTLTCELEKGKTYYIWPFYYNTSSVSFTVSSIKYEPIKAEMSSRNIYESNMLLQRDEPVYIDGTCTKVVTEGTAELINEASGETVQTKHINFDTNEWNVTFDAVSDYENTYTIKLSANGVEDITYTNVIFGDQYIFSGQSNMWMSVASYKSIDKDEYSADAVKPHLTDKIRLMYTPGQSDYGTNVLQYNAQNKKPWRDFSTYANIQDVGAPAYSAAIRLHEETGVPIGVIDNAYPGSYISSWFDSALKIDNCNTGKNSNANERNWFCGRIYPLRNLRIKAVFWYQGEADAATKYHDNPYSYYSEMMPKLIDTWRELFNNQNMGFYYTQLSRIGSTIVDENNPDTGAAGKMPIKLAQTDIYRNLADKTNIGVASTLDLYGNHDAGGSRNCRTDIHLAQKQFVGERYAAMALADIYGKTEYKNGSALYKMGPMYKESAVNGSCVEVKFDCNGSLAIMPSSRYTDSIGETKIASGEINPNVLNEFEILDNEGTWHSASAEITSEDTVTVSCDEVSEPKGVRYCGKDYPESPNLTDDSGMPSYVFSQTF